MKKLSTLVFLSIWPFCTGCSVILAASPSEEPNLQVLAVGTTETQVEEELGLPISSIRTRSGKINTYQYFSGDRESYGRAAAYTVLDVLTIGLAEIVTTPIEALQGDKHTVKITYNFNDCVTKVTQETLSAPLPNPNTLLGFEKKPEEASSLKPISTKEEVGISGSTEQDKI